MEEGDDRHAGIVHKVGDLWVRARDRLPGVKCTPSVLHTCFLAVAVCILGPAVPDPWVVLTQPEWPWAEAALQAVLDGVPSKRPTCVNTGTLEREMRGVLPNNLSRLL